MLFSRGRENGQGWQNGRGGRNGRGAKRTAVAKMSVTHDALNFIIRQRYIYYIFGISIYIMCRHVPCFLIVRTHKLSLSFFATSASEVNLGSDFCGGKALNSWFHRRKLLKIGILRI